LFLLQQEERPVSIGRPDLIIRRWLGGYGRLGIWAVALALFLGIMTALRVSAGEPVTISEEPLNPLRRAATTFHPAVDTKRRLLRDMFDYRAPIDTDFDDYLRAGEFVRAYQLAYLDSDYRKMTAAVVGLRAHLVRLRSGDEESKWQISSLQTDIVNALDASLLFEAFAFERMGAIPAARQRYSRYLELLKQLGPVQIDQSVLNVDRRLSVIRIKLFLTRESRSGGGNATPYLDGLTSSFLEQLPPSKPYSSYFEQGLLPESGTDARSPYDTADAAILNNAATHLDFCLSGFGPHRDKLSASRWDAPCGAEYYLQRHGGFDLAVAILEYNRLHNRLVRLQNPGKRADALLDYERAREAPPPQRYDPAVRPILDATLVDARALIDRIPTEAPEATFLMDDLIDDISEFILTGRDRIFSPQQIAQGAHDALVQQVICDVTPISQRTVYIFDRREHLLNRLREVGRQCG
jgi:hypothetical protein